MVPTQFVRLLGLPEDVRAKYDVSSLRHMVHAAAPCPPEVKRQMLEWWGPVIDEYYAASEGGGTIVFAEEWLEHPGTVGRAWPTSEIVILDDDDNELPAGEIGTVYMHMKTGDFEYFKDKQKTDNSRRGKFFTVGDVGYLDDDGWLFLSDRKNDMIISGGANIYPAEIESVLIMHPKVADVAVFGIPHADWGEEVKAVVEPIDGVDGGPELEAEILAWSVDKLAKYKTPRVDRLRRGAPPRPQRQALQAQAARPVLGRPRARHLTHVRAWPMRTGNVLVVVLGVAGLVARRDDRLAGTASASGRSPRRCRRRRVRPRSTRCARWPASSAPACVAGFLVPGLGGRLFMRVLAATSGSGAQGRLTEADEVVGDITFDGSLGFVIFVGLVIPVAAALRLPRCSGASSPRPRSSPASSSA